MPKKIFTINHAFHILFFFIYLSIGMFFGWVFIVLSHSSLFWIYYIGLPLFGLIDGIICKKMHFSAFFLLILGQILYLILLAKTSAYTGIALIFVILNSVLILFGNAVGAVIADKKIH